jgi:hypothetical protein
MVLARRINLSSARAKFRPEIESARQTRQAKNRFFITCSPIKLYNSYDMKKSGGKLIPPK